LGVFAAILLNNILPAFLVMALGVLLDRLLAVDKKSLSRMAIYVLLPCLVFSSLVQSSVDPGEFGLMILFAGAIILVMCALALLVGHLLGWSSRSVDALVLTVGFFNAGNLGLSIIVFCFGDAALELGLVFYTALSFASNTVSAFFAARSNSRGREALGKVLRLPGLYVFVLALVLRGLGVQVPEALLKSVDLVGRAAVPVMLLMLGLQLSQSRVAGRYKEVAVGVVLRLGVGALAAAGIAPLVGLEGLARKVAITQAATPTAVSSGLMAIEFDADAEYVTSVILVSTLLSSVTLALVLSLLG